MIDVIKNCHVEISLSILMVRFLGIKRPLLPGSNNRGLLVTASSVDANLLCDIHPPQRNGKRESDSKQCSKFSIIKDIKLFIFLLAWAHYNESVM